MMSGEEIPSVYGYTIFCDDIRQEISGKLFLIGVYSSTMFIHGAFPATLPHFGALISYSERRDRYNGPVSIQVFLPGDSAERPSVEAPIDIEEARNTASPAGAVSNSAEADYVSVNTNILLHPLILKEPGFIRVKAKRADKDVLLGSLAVLGVTS
jgi:hypothetical protein